MVYNKDYTPKDKYPSFIFKKGKLSLDVFKLGKAVFSGRVKIFASYKDYVVYRVVRLGRDRFMKGMSDTFLLIRKGDSFPLRGLLRKYRISYPAEWNTVNKELIKIVSLGGPEIPPTVEQQIQELVQKKIGVIINNEISEPLIAAKLTEKVREVLQELLEKDLPAILNRELPKIVEEQVQNELSSMVVKVIGNDKIQIDFVCLSCQASKEPSTFVDVLFQFLYYLNTCNTFGTFS